MIGWLRGRLHEREAGRVVLDVGGVGYLLHVPMSTFLELPEVGRDVELTVLTHVREDALTLFGFREATERRLFELLLSVSGVGPRIALAALSALGPAELEGAIVRSDAALLSTVPGIGRKTAERLVVDLRDRLGTGAAAASGAPSASAPAGPAADVVSALVNLGYAEKQVVKVVREAVKDEPRDFDDLLRESLRRLSRA